MSREWKNPQNPSEERLKDTSLGDFLSKITELKGELEALIEKDKDAIRRVEREVSKLTSQKGNRVKDEQ